MWAFQTWDSIPLGPPNTLGNSCQVFTLGEGLFLQNSLNFVAYALRLLLSIVGEKALGIGPKPWESVLLLYLQQAGSKYLWGMWEEKWSCNGHSRALFYRELPPETKKLGRVFLGRAINLVQAKNSGRIKFPCATNENFTRHLMCEGASPFFLWVGGREGRGGEGASFFQVVVQSGLSTVHFPLRQWTVDFSCKHFLYSILGEGKWVKAKSLE